MQKQNGACITYSSSSAIVKTSHDNPVIKYDYAFNTDLLESVAIQRENLNKSAKETNGKRKNFAPSVQFLATGLGITEKLIRADSALHVLGKGVY